MERTLKKERPGRWMPVVWLLFAVALTVGIIATVQTFVPINPTDRANATVSEPVDKPAQPIAAASPASPAAPDLTSAPVLKETPAPLKETPAPPPSANPAPTAVTVATEPVAPPTAPPAESSAAANRLVEGEEATLTTRTQAAWREGGRSSGLTYLPPGTKVVVVQVLPDDKYVVHWREAEAEVPGASLAPIDP